MKTIRWGIIGCGDVCEVKSGPGFQKARNSELVAVMRRDGAKAKDFAQRHGVPRWYDDAQKLIDDPQVDAIYVATPPNAHAEYAIRAAQAGKPVYVEKPMARTFEECQQMVAATQNAGVPLWVAYYRRRLPRFVKAKELLGAGAIGDVRAVTVRHFQPGGSTDARGGLPIEREKLPWRVRPEIAGAGLFFDLASHTLDVLDYLLGPIKDVGGAAANQANLYPAEDIVAAHWQHQSGVLGTGIWCFTAGHSTDWNEIIGDKGRIGFTSFGTQPLEWHHDNEIETFDLPNPPHVHQPLIQTIVDELNGVGTCPSTAHSGARTSWVMDAILRDFRAAQPTAMDVKQNSAIAPAQSTRA